MSQVESNTPWSEGPPADYQGGSLLNLAASLAAAMGVEAAGPGLDGLAGRDPAFSCALSPLLSRLPEARTVVLLLLDGVGQHPLQRLVPHGVIAGQTLAWLDSVYPSSTAPAITSMLTARAPADHGNPGWFLWHEQAARSLRTLPMDWRDAPGEPVQVPVWTWQGWMAASPVPCFGLQPADICDSVYSQRALAGATRLGYINLDHLAAQVIGLVRGARPGRRFIYAYAPDFDSIAHRFGWQSEQALGCLRELDDLVARLAEAVRGEDALLLTAADHGFCDVPADRQFRIEAFPALAKMLRAPLSGEPRVAFCHLHPGRVEAFVEQAGSALAGIARAVPSRTLLDAGWFGPRPATAMRERFGDVTLLMADNTSISDRLPDERAHRMIGMHGGGSAAEMKIPLSVIDGLRD
ncbi:MAG: alkaline phosphatase family protein [Burkholderiaceae bacterium]